MEYLEDAKKLLERILTNIKESSMSEGDKKYIGELIELTNEKIDMTLDKDVEKP